MMNLQDKYICFGKWSCLAQCYIYAALHNIASVEERENKDFVENVYFNDNFMVTSPIGTITSIPGGSVTLNAKGKNIKQVLTSLLTAKKNPSASSNVSSGAKCLLSP